jgi:N6-adenosine-specific RNA methylase IME4
VRFPVIVADPPWHFKVWGEGARRSASHHYDVQPTDWIASVPVADVAAPDCTLLLWVCWPKLRDAWDVIDAWGFEYKTLGYDWIKTTQAGTPAWGMGYYTRANSEPCLLATRGKPKRLDKGVSQVLACGTGRHSEKPFEFYERTERLLAGPYLELFGRPHGTLLDGSRDGWTRLGNELTGNDMAVDLRRLADADDPPTTTGGSEERDSR